MKTFLKVIAWVGVGFMLITTVLTFKLSWEYSHYIPDPRPVMRGVYWFLVPPLDIIALGSMLVGGIVTRPKYIWPVYITIGFLNICSYYAYVTSFINHIFHPALFDGGSIFFFSFAIVPGVIAIVEGLILRVARNKI